VNPDEVVAIVARVRLGVWKGEVKDVSCCSTPSPAITGIETIGGVYNNANRQETTTISTVRARFLDRPAGQSTAVTIRGFQGASARWQPTTACWGSLIYSAIPPRGREECHRSEVTFDIDGNGIVNVHAKRPRPNKEQSIKITASTGLSRDEIKKMVRESGRCREDRKRGLAEANPAQTT